MDLVSLYGNQIKKRIAEKPQTAARMINFGLTYEHFRCKHLADKNLPEAYRYLNTYAVDYVRKALKQPDKTVWANIFSPVEILQCFGLYSLSIECLASFLSGFRIEDSLLEVTDQEGFAKTLCSYHRAFIGAIDSGIIPPASFALTTSTICDGNVQTFSHLAGKHQVPSYVIDVPMSDHESAHEYVVSQLKELIELLSDRFHRSFSMEQLKKVLIRENESKARYESFLKQSVGRYYPSTLTLQMYMLFATHLNIGEPGILEFFKIMEREIQNAPAFEGPQILWVHLLPYYQETLKKYFNVSKTHQIQAIEMNLDYRAPLDVDHPLDALADKIINNIYTRGYERKAGLVADLAKELKSDGVINFCHWGCKQSSGGVMLLREKLKQEGIPFLVLDGDGMDRANSHDGQIKTRFEAFLEILEQKRNSASLTNDGDLT